MQPFVFLGGVLTGASCLLAASLYNSKKTEAKYSPDIKTSENLTPSAVARQLNVYFFKAQDIYTKVNDIVIKGAELIATPIDLPDDGLMQKAANSLGGSLNRINRKLYVSQLNDLKSDAKKLYA